LIINFSQIIKLKKKKLKLKLTHFQSHSVVLSDSSLYVFGGIDNNNKVLEDFYRYDLGNNIELDF